MIESKLVKRDETWGSKIKAFMVWVINAGLKAESLPLKLIEP